MSDSVITGPARALIVSITTHRELTSNEENAIVRFIEELSMVVGRPVPPVEFVVSMNGAKFGPAISAREDIFSGNDSLALYDRVNLILTAGRSAA